MATWNEVRDYLAGRYGINDLDAELIQLTFGVGNGRTQMVFVGHHRLETEGAEEHWVQIFSPIGPVAEIDLEQALTRVGPLTCGSLAILPDNLVHLRHSAPLADMSTAELVSPLELITISADRLEREFVTGDRF